ncbi:MCE family protein [Nocardioides sp. W3-2-3]|uniref:MlaD family protein n=1 Tax=Nocardioides convexus TaxID=2712224 RepID=UPI00241881F0|nr:MlaD family protein [Nocardioides convexus]NHA01246.1 MCE family protein [Nocardioides convexus]
MLTVVALFFAVVVYARVPTMVGVGVYDVRAEYSDASGLYPKAMVTYQGVKVGEVAELEVGDGGATAVLRIDDEHDIPATVVAELHSTSAIGEQYVDLVPAPEGAADPEQSTSLADGDVIPVDRTVEMPQITPVLESVNDLLESVPRERTRRVLDQVDEGLGGSGPDLASTIEDADESPQHRAGEIGRHDVLDQDRPAGPGHPAGVAKHDSWLRAVPCVLHR